MERQPEGKQHILSVTDRKEIQVTGVKDVGAFDEKEMVLQTQQGTLYIRGEGLHVTRLSLESGEADVTGQINQLEYHDKLLKKNASSFAARLFR